MSNKSIAAIVAVCIGLLLFFAANPFGVMAWNSWFGLVQRADDATNYETLKQVEDTCRSMIASYEADRLTYEQYKNSDDDEQQSWAEQAKMRANRMDDPEFVYAKAKIDEQIRSIVGEDKFSPWEVRYGEIS